MNINNCIIFILSGLYILHDMPMLGFRYPSMLYAVLVALLFVLLLWNIGIKRVLKILPIFAIPFLDVLIGSTTTFTLLQGFSGILQLLILPMLAIFLFEEKRKKIAIGLFVLYIGINFITCFTTYQGCQLFPNASRELATSYVTESPFYYIYLSANIGGFSFVYTMVLFLVLSICTIKNYKQLPHPKICLVLAIAFIIGIILAIIAAEYTTAILLVAVCLLLFFEKRSFKIKRIMFWGIVALFTFATFKTHIADGIINIAGKIESNNISHRLTDLALSIEGKHTQDHSDMDAREEKYTKSITLFISNPIGSWGASRTGGHSYILDSLARYGIIGLVLLCFTFKIIYTNYIKPLRGRFVYGYAVISFLLFLVMATLNPKAFTDFILFVLPLYVLLLTKKKNIYHKHSG